MRLPITVDGNDVVVRCPEPGATGDEADVATVDELVAAATATPVAGTAVTVGGRPIELTTPILAAAIRPGDDVRVRGHAVASAPPTALTVHVVAGVDAGRVVPVPAPTAAAAGNGGDPSRSVVTVGRGADATVRLASPAVSKLHCTITVTGDGTGDGAITVTDAGSRNGTVVGSERLGHAPVSVALDEPIRCGPSIVVVRRATGDDTPRHLAEQLAGAPSGPVPFFRSPVDLVGAGAEAVAAPVAPRRPRTGRPGLIGMLLPIAVAVVAVKVTGQWMYAMFALMSPIMMTVQLLDRAGRNRRIRRRSRRRYRQELADFAAELDAAMHAELRRRRAMHPDVTELVRRATAGSAALWDRRRSHPQFLELAVGTTDVAWEPPVQGYSPDARLADVDAAMEAVDVLPSVPLPVSLRPGSTLGLAGEADGALATARGLLLQVAAHHGPAEVRIVVVASRERVAEWEWTKWLPHVRPSSFGEGRLLAVASDERGALDGTAIDEVVADAESGAVLFVVIDTVGLADAGDLAVRRLLRRDSVPTAGLVVAATPDGLPDVCDVVVTHHQTVGEATCRWPRDGGRSVDVVVRGITTDVALAAARGVARFSDPDASGGSASLPARIGLAAVLGLERADAATITARWAAAGAPAAVVGLSDRGPVAVDLGATAAHVAVVGGRGAGKTEQLLGIVLGLATAQPPERLHLVLWGEAFGTLHRLPHVASTVSRVDETSVAAVVDGLDRELSRRERQRVNGTIGDEPRLVIVVDDVDTIARVAPRIGDDLVRVARRARGLGVSLIWSASRAAGMGLAELVDLSASRVVLRVATGAESTELLGTDAAAELERSLPGRAYVVTGGAEAREVQGGAVTSGAPARHDGLEITDFRLTGGVATQHLGPPDERALVNVLVAAGAMRPRPPDLLSPAAAAVSQVESPGLLELLGLDGDGALARAGETWQTGDTDGFLRVPIGVDLDVRPVLLDLKESALAGMGPHGLLVGATGSGKSELLRTLVSGLAVTHSPEMLAFVLVDFKGGASFASFGRLPHVAGVVTNLADDLALVDRILAALGGEQRRRQELLAAAGNLGNVREYRAARRAGTLPEALRDQPLPQLLVIVDEFAELLDSQPDFIDFFLTIGRVGRSLGIHLLLASQRLEEGKLRGLDTYLSYRLGLRTFSAIESRTVLGVPDAYSLPSAPGGGYLKVGNTSFERFQASYVSGPIGGDGLAGDGDGVADATVMSTIVDHLEHAAERVHQIWLPPLGPAIPLDTLFGPAGFVQHAERGFAAARWPGTAALGVPVGVVDEPELQRQIPLVLDFAGASGNLAVVGAPQSGKSMLLRSTVLSLAITHTPAEVQIYAIDLGGGTLASIAGLPHVGTVASRLEPDLVARVIGHVEVTLTQREQLFRERGIDSAATLRRMRAAGELDDPASGDVFLIVDGWGAFRERFDHLESTVADLAARGLGYGVHVVVAANRWLDIRSNLLEALGGRLELRLNNPTDSMVDRRKSATIRDDQPGRGLHPSKRIFQAAIPRLDGAATVQQLPAATALAVEHIAGRWPGPPTPAVRLLPSRITVAELTAAADPDTVASPTGVVVGLQEAGMRPWVLDLGAEPHFLVYGDGESGKTTFLQTWLCGLAEATPRERTRIVLADYRRTLLGVVPDSHLHGYAASEPALREMLESVVATVESRLPGADVTAAQLRDRSWWRGPDLYVVVDDHDLVMTGGTSPLQVLVPHLAQGRDLGLHVILTRRVGGAAKAMFEPVTSRLRELGTNGLILSGERDEGALLGQVRAAHQPPGRGTLVMRRDAPTLVQVAVRD